MRVPARYLHIATFWSLLVSALSRFFGLCRPYFFCLFPPPSHVFFSSPRLFVLCLSRPFASQPLVPSPLASTTWSLGCQISHASLPPLLHSLASFDLSFFGLPVSFSSLIRPASLPSGRFLRSALGLPSSSNFSFSCGCHGPPSV